MRAILLTFLLLTACTRPLTPAETALVAPLHGPSLDTAQVRIARSPLAGAFPHHLRPAPRSLETSKAAATVQSHF